MGVQIQLQAVEAQALRRRGDGALTPKHSVPIEELFAWKDLAAEGSPVEDIAADFGVTPLVVQRRLKLGTSSECEVVEPRRME